MNMNNHLFPRLGAFFFEHGLSTRRELIAQFRDLSLTAVQIADPLMKELVANPSEAAAVAQDFQEAGLDIVGLAGYRNLISPDPVKRRENIDFLKACMDLAPVLGTAVVSTETGTFHPDSDWDPSPQNSSPQAWGVLLESLGELLEKAKATGTVLALEGYVNNIVGRLDQIDALFRTFSTPHLTLMLDPYNYISRNLLPAADLICDEFLTRYADRFVIAHLKDVAPLGANRTPDGNGGRADLVGTPEFCTGVFPQQSYMRFLRDRRPDLPIILEHLPVSHLPEAMRKFRSLVGLPV